MNSVHSHSKAIGTGLGLRLKLYKKRVQYRLKREVKRLLSSGEQVGLVIGSGPSQHLVGPGGSHFQGWLITDVGILNALRRTDWGAIFGPGQIARIFAEHVIEHWSEDEFREFLRIAAHFLAPNGNIRVAVPDGFHPDRTYIDAVKPGGTGPGADDHKVLYDYQTLESILSEENWSYDLLEYFDERGVFHSKPWDPVDGFIERSEHNDPRNRDQALSYTSLIVDLRRDD